MAIEKNDYMSNKFNSIYNEDQMITMMINEIEKNIIYNIDDIIF